jgi:hypothetical protein
MFMAKDTKVTSKNLEWFDNPKKDILMRLIEQYDMMNECVELAKLTDDPYMFWLPVGRIMSRYHTPTRSYPRAKFFSMSIFNELEKAGEIKIRKAVKYEYMKLFFTIMYAIETRRPIKDNVGLTLGRFKDVLPKIAEYYNLSYSSQQGFSTPDIITTYKWYPVINTILTDLDDNTFLVLSGGDRYIYSEIKDYIHKRYPIAMYISDIVRRSTDLTAAYEIQRYISDFVYATSKLFVFDYPHVSSYIRRELFIDNVVMAGAKVYFLTLDKLPMYESYRLGEAEHKYNKFVHYEIMSKFMHPALVPELSQSENVEFYTLI